MSIKDIIYNARSGPAGAAIGAGLGSVGGGLMGMIFAGRKKRRMGAGLGAVTGGLAGAAAGNETGWANGAILGSMAGAIPGYVTGEIQDWANVSKASREFNAMLDEETREEEEGESVQHEPSVYKVHHPLGSSAEERRMGEDLAKLLARADDRYQANEGLIEGRGSVDKQSMKSKGVLK